MPRTLARAYSCARLPARLFKAAALLLCGPILSFAAGNVIELTYDPAGNVTDIKRQVVPGFAITSIDPASGATGATVTIYGTGFSSTPANNLVKFNGVTASVSAASSGSISTTVPATATTGRVTVTVGGSTATSPQDFVVVVPGVPTVTSFSPARGVATTSISVSGTSFDAGSVVKLNGTVAAASIASLTSLSFNVPAATASGRITVTNGVGTGVSAQDFVVPPAGVAAADIVTVIRLQPGGSASPVSVPPSSKHALVLFDGAVDTYYTMQFGQYGSSPSIATTPYKIIKPDNTVLSTGFVGTSGARPTIHIPKLPATGTYSILLSPGTATFDSNVKVAADPVLAVDGTSVSTSLDFQGQTSRVVFDATAAGPLGLGVSGLTLSPSTTAATPVAVYKPDGSLLANIGECSVTSSNSEGNCDLELAPVTVGLHTVVFTVPASSAANFSAQLSTDLSGSVAQNGSVDFTTTRVGQDGRYTFTVAAGDSLGVDIAGVSTLPAGRTINASVRNPGGTPIASTSATQPAGGYMELGTLTTAGTYSIVVDPAFGSTGTARLFLKGGTLLGTTDTPSNFTTGSIGETARFRFAGTAGQNVSIAMSALSYAGTGFTASTLTVYKPDGTALGTPASCLPTTLSGRCRVLLTNLPATGTYGIAVRPPGGVTLTGTILASGELAVPLTAGASSSLATTRAGQAIRLSFSAAAGDSFALKLFGITTNPAGQTVNVTVYQPSGSVLPNTFSASTTINRVIDIPNIPVTGTYTVLVDPGTGLTFQGTALLDAGVTLTLDGSSATLPTGSVGEPFRYRVAGTSGQRFELGISSLTYAAGGSGSTSVTMVRPDASSVILTSACAPGATGCEGFVNSLPVTGTYSLIVSPPTTAAITGGTLAISTPLTGSFTIGAAAGSVGVARPGQTLRHTFAGTAAQLLRLTWSSTAIAGGSSVAINILKPDGSSLVMGSFANGATAGLDIPSLPTTGTYTVVLDPATAATFTANMAVVTR